MSTTAPVLSDTSTVKPATPAKRPFRFSRWFFATGWRHLVGIAMIVFAVFPLLYVLSASLNPYGTLAASNALFSVIDVSNYAALGETRFWTWAGNTLLIGGIAAVGAVLMGAAAAYAFSRFRFSGRRAGLTGLLIIQMFPQMLAFVAIFLLLISLGNVVPVLGLDSKLSLICVYLGGALGVNTFLMYGFFNTVPREIDEAAKIDGASHAQIYWTIVLRLTAPILAVVALLSFIFSVNEFAVASVMLIDTEKQTLAVGLTKLVSNPRYADWSAFSAGAVMAALPVVALFLFLQRYIVGGLTAGSVK